MFWRTLGRLILLPIAALIAAVTSLFVLLTLGLEKLTHATFDKVGGPETVGTFFGIFAQGIDLAAGLTIVPALALVIIGEVARIRSWLYYVAGGGLALAAIPLLGGISQTEAFVIPAATVWQVFATAGFAGGFVYWLLAGRNA
jgi:hypothetical protein